MARQSLFSSVYAHTHNLCQLLAGDDLYLFMLMVTCSAVATDFDIFLQAQVAPEVTPGKAQNLPPEITLRYSCYKNLASINMNRKSYQEACDYYLKVSVQKLMRVITFLLYFPSSFSYSYSYLAFSLVHCVPRCIFVQPVIPT